MTNRNSAKVRTFGGLVPGAPVPAWAAPGFVCGDISGSEAGILTAGCYLGLEEQWTSATADWNAILAEAGVDAFHATDFYSASGAFDDDKWRREVPGRGMVVGGPLHVEFSKRFSAAAVDAGLIGFALAMDVPAFIRILAPELAKEKRRYRSTDPRTWMSHPARIRREVHRPRWRP